MSKNKKAAEKEVTVSLTSGELEAILYLVDRAKIDFNLIRTEEQLEGFKAFTSAVSKLKLAQF